MQASLIEIPVSEGAGAAVASEAEADGEVEPVAVQEEGAESEHPLAYHPISSVLARPTILRPAVTGYPTLRIDRTGFGNSSRQSSLKALSLAARFLVLKPPTQLSLWSRQPTRTRFSCHNKLG